MSDKNKSWSLRSIENRLAALTLVASLLPSMTLLAVLWLLDVSPYSIGIAAVLLTFLALFAVTTVWRQAQFHFQSAHNLLEAIVRGDYSFRGAQKEAGGAFSDLMDTINGLAEAIQRQRLQSEESQLLLQKVVDQIDVAIIAWDQHDVIQLINPAARSLLYGHPGTDAAVHTKLPEKLAFTDDMTIGATLVRDLEFDEERGRFRLHLESFITEGDTHKLLFLTNVSSILRMEERRAWRNLVRVLSHEINNSLAPLKSFSDSLQSQIEQRETDAELKKELLDAMSVIGKRADAMASFVQSYHELAKLPEPDKESLDFRQLVEGLTKFFPTASISLVGDSTMVRVDGGQLEQVLINLIKNAVEASAAESAIEIAWHADARRLNAFVRDSGEGIQNPENLFTPYYTTKQAGSGIGLVFCQQVIEAHGGYLDISNRDDKRGCEAAFSLPLR